MKPLPPLNQPRPRAGRTLLRAIGKLAVTLLILASSLLWIVSAVVWVRSYWVPDWMRWGTVSKQDRAMTDVTVWSARGGVGAFIETTHGGFGPGDFAYRTDVMLEYPYVPIPELKQGWHVQFAGCTLFRHQGMHDLRMQNGGSITRITYRFNKTVVILPWWMLLVIATPAPLITILRVRRKRSRKWRRAHGLCVQCGYDLRATPQRCPECGKEVGK